MAREEHDREDLLAEATALAERVCLRIEGREHDLVVGFRRDGGASFYVSPDLVYHFNSVGQLRRAFVAGRLYKAVDGQLVSMTRRRGDDAVILESHELDAVEAEVFLRAIASELARLGQDLAANSYTRIGQVPSASDVIARVREWLARHGNSILLARTPRAN